jgi:hypothetical protein
MQNLPQAKKPTLVVGNKFITCIHHQNLNILNYKYLLTKKINFNFF